MEGVGDFFCVILVYRRRLGVGENLYIGDFGELSLYRCLVSVKENRK
jgi:hypothetical protein